MVPITESPSRATPSRTSPSPASLSRASSSRASLSRACPSRTPSRASLSRASLSRASLSRALPSSARRCRCHRPTLSPGSSAAAAGTTAGGLGARRCPPSALRSPRLDRDRACLPHGGGGTASSETARGSPLARTSPGGAAVSSFSLTMRPSWRSIRVGGKPSERPSWRPASAARTVRSRTAPASKTSETSPSTQPPRARAPREPPSSPFWPATPNARTSSLASGRSCPAVRRRRCCSPSTFAERSPVGGRHRAVQSRICARGIACERVSPSLRPFGVGRCSMVTAKNSRHRLKIRGSYRILRVKV